VSTTWFTDAYSEPLRDWLQDLFQDADRQVVAISRKCPRLLELCVADGLLSGEALQVVVSEKALTLAVSVPSRYIIVDDLFSHGSTFARIRAVAEQRVGVERVLGIPFAMATGANPENAKAVTRFCCPVPEGDHVSLTNAEVSSFASLNKPYDIEHPILTCRLQSTERPLAEVVAGIAESSGWIATPRRTAMADGTIKIAHAWSVLIPDGRSGQASFAKMRLYLGEEGNLRIVPVAPVAATVRSIGEVLRQQSTLTRKLWEEATIGLPSLREHGQLLQEQSLVVWGNYVLELWSLLPQIATLQSVLDQAGLRRSELSLDAFDIGLLIGPDRAQSAVQTLTEIANSPEVSRTPFYLPDRPIAPTGNLPADLIPSYEDSLRLRLGYQTDDPVWTLACIFMAQNTGIEKLSRETDPHNPLRMEFGVPFAYLRALMEEREYSARELHRALDALVDAGVAVPRFLMQVIGDERVWYRGFRTGEATIDELAKIASEGSRTLCEALGEEVLGRLFTEKFFVVLGEYAGLFHTASSQGATAALYEVDRAWDRLGARESLSGVHVKAAYVDHMALIGALESDPAGFRPGREAGDLFPKKTLNNTQLRTLYDFVRWTAEARQLPEDFLIAITSVESEPSYEQALIAELAGYVGEARITLATLARIPRLPDGRRQAANLSTPADWVKQARKKIDLRSRLSDFIKDGDRIWHKSETDTGGTWHLGIKERLRARALLPGDQCACIEAEIDVADALDRLLQIAILAAQLGNRSPGSATHQRGGVSPNLPEAMRSFLAAAELCPEIHSRLTVAKDGEVPHRYSELIAVIQDGLSALEAGLEFIQGRIAARALQPRTIRFGSPPNQN
jgi:hypothetical protein